jgi:hypothetical protein
MAEWEARLARDGLAVIGAAAGAHCRDADTVVARTEGSVWELAANVDLMLAALYRYPFRHVVDGMICEMLSRRVPWWRIARTLRCSKRRVSRVSRDVLAWRDPESEAA